MSETTLRAYRVLGVTQQDQKIGTIAELIRLIAQHINSDGSVLLPLTLREELDELSARRNEPRTITSRLRIDSVHFAPDPFVNAHDQDDVYAHITQDDKGLLLYAVGRLNSTPVSPTRP